MNAGQSDLCKLIERIVRKDELALADLYDRTSSIVFGLSRRIVNDRFLAEDITQEVYFQVWRRASRYDPNRGSPFAWIVAITRSRAIDCFRVAKKNEGLERPNSRIECRPVETTAGMVDQDRCEIISRALNFLSPVQREAIELSYYLGFSHSEIASKMNQPLGTVKSHIRTGMLKLRDSLQSLRDDL